ncbi:hypothetical protein JR316_0003063 [Psilocybe cubensis]|uniref:Uncharacterized protein n=2 Tax=Psilocybe cubensis TaxID=181762 RepID=A0ACB8H6P0_PSICU|nr:hypothetical protein JR316_0003063 [Psilocybe cubensis]KAH9483593.1 hypothetical protein JR316_0003063 [Psilocybe cubensis]
MSNFSQHPRTQISLLIYNITYYSNPSALKNSPKPPQTAGMRDLHHFTARREQLQIADFSLHHGTSSLQPRITTSIRIRQTASNGEYAANGRGTHATLLLHSRTVSNQVRSSGLWSTESQRYSRAEEC